MKPIELEVCCATLDDVRNAVSGGATRIELCTALSVGGLTPTESTINNAKYICKGKAALHVLIRHREGDFVLNPADYNSSFFNEAERASCLGVDGIVIGLLKKNGKIDLANCAKVIERAKMRGLSVTFSRAFDLVANPLEELEKLHVLGCDRLLTSGCAPTAWEGRKMIKELVKHAPKGLSIIAASGINTSNFKQIIEETGVREIHGSFRHELPRVGKSLPGLDATIMRTSYDDVKFISDAIKTL